MKQRIQKVLSEYGIASRRAAEEMIRAGRISLNGQVISLGDHGDPEVDQIMIDGVPLASAPKRVYLLMNKPRGFITSVQDEQGRKTVIDLLPPETPRVYPVGRLDLNSEGLLLLTNDGELCQHLIHPSHHVDKTYLVWVQGNYQTAVSTLNQSMKLDGVWIQPPKTVVIKEFEGGALLKIVIHEGKNRQIRKMCQQVGLSVSRLKRVAIGTLELRDLPVGQVRPLSQREITYLKDLGANSR